MPESPEASSIERENEWQENFSIADILDNNEMLKNLLEKIDKLKKADEETSWKEFVESNDRGEVPKKIKKAIEEIGMDGELLEFLFYRVKNKVVGLDVDSLIEHTKNYLDFCGELKDTKVKPFCPPILAMVHTLCGEDLSGKTIVEVGPGRAGIDVLAYFASRGAKVIAIDVGRNNKDVLDKYPDVEFIQGNWEDLKDHMNGRKADIIYTINMELHPERGGEFDGDLHGFEDHVKKATDKVLQPLGAYIGLSVDSDFVLVPDELFEPDKDIFLQKGYQVETFGDDRKIDGKIPKRLDPESESFDDNLPNDVKAIVQKTIDNKKSFLYGEFRFIKVIQKPSIS